MRGTGPKALHELADAYGIVSVWDDIDGIQRTTSDETRIALLSSMGVDASTGPAVRAALDRLETRRRASPIDPVTVLRGEAGALRARLPFETRGTLDWRIDIITEEGDRLESEGSVRTRSGQSTVRLGLPAALDLGYHIARIRLACAGETAEAETFLIAPPPRCTPVRDAINGDRAFGIVANLYTLRSRDNWGVGDLTDLGRLCDWAGEEGADFVGINPLHALRNSGDHISPYSPVSRLFRNVAYIDVTAVPEFAEDAAARAMVENAGTQSRLESLRAADHVDYEAVMRLKRPVLEALHDAFRAREARGPTDRGRAYSKFVWRHGAALRDFATFEALADHFGEPDWRAWPAPYRDPRSSEVAAFREANGSSVDFHSFLQYELDRQLGEAAAAGSAAGMRIGLYGDLAIGSAVSGSDRWSFPELFVSGAAVGAPPDAYAPQGQNWSLPPIDPNRLPTTRFRYWILLVRNALAHCGALRIDHVMGLFRQFWIPEGRTGEEGTYVRYPFEPLLAVLAIESRRRGAIVIGEDLGTVPRGLPSLLARWGVLSTRVLYFERDARGGFRPPSSYSRRALVTVNTHDHAPLAGWWTGRDIEIRHEIGDLGDAQRAEALRRRADERNALRERLAAARILPAAARVEGPDLSAAVHAFLARTHAPLLGVSLDDLAGETEPVNLPGVTAERYPAWTRRMRLPLDSLSHDADVNRAIQGVESRVRGIAG